MLGQARTRAGVEWVLGDAASAAWSREFDLAVMTGHAFQVLAADEELRRSLRAIRAALVDGGRFAFETRHPQARAWEGWNGSYEVWNPDGDAVTVSYEVHDVTGDVVRVSETLSGRWWADGYTEQGLLRFLAPDGLGVFLDEAGFAVEEQFGDWHRGLLTDRSEEIVTVARVQAGYRSDGSVRDTPVVGTRRRDAHRGDPATLLGGQLRHARADQPRQGRRDEGPCRLGRAVRAGERAGGCGCSGARLDCARGGGRRLGAVRGGVRAAAGHGRVAGERHQR